MTFRIQPVAQALGQLADTLSLADSAIEVRLPDWAWRDLRDRLGPGHLFTNDIGDEYLALDQGGVRFTSKGLP